jgi:hypothetical protein
MHRFSGTTNARKNSIRPQRNMLIHPNRAHKRRAFEFISFSWRVFEPCFQHPGGSIQDQCLREEKRLSLQRFWAAGVSSMCLGQELAKQACAARAFEAAAGGDCILRVQVAYT